MTKTNPPPATSVSRRKFLAVGGVGVVGLTLRDARAASQKFPRAVIQIVQNGGASQIDTFDPKPDAPREIRGPVRAISTAIPGVHFAESLPMLAQRADRLVVLRALHHEAAPIHETGRQLYLTGALARLRQRPPHLGFVLQHTLAHGHEPTGVGAHNAGPAVAVELNAPGDHGPHRPCLGNDNGLFAGDGDLSFLPNAETIPSILSFADTKDFVRQQYGKSKMGELMWTAARLIESGVRHVTINTFEELDGHVTWDAHGCKATAPGTVFDYRDAICPQFDKAVAALLDDLEASGRLQQTLVVCTGEMGRTSRINEQNGRDHWTQAWSGFLAGGGLEGGQVIGATDAQGETITDEPVALQQLPALILEFLGVTPSTEVTLATGVTWTTPAASQMLT